MGQHFWIICVLSLLSLNLTGCSSVGYRMGDRLMATADYDKAISAYQKELQNQTDPATKMGALHNMGVAYQHLGDSIKSAEYFQQGVNAMPERGYYGYLNLAYLSYREGKITAANDFILKAKDLASTPAYQNLEQNSRYGKNTIKNAIFAASDFYRLRMLYQNMISKQRSKFYREAMQIAEEILKGSNHVDFLFDLQGNTIVDVSNGSLADLNGMVKGDQIIKVGDTPVATGISTQIELRNLLTNYYDKFGSTVDITIQRNNRTIVLHCKLTYPEIAQARFLLQDARNQILAPINTTTEDTEPPTLKVIDPKPKRGFSVVSKQAINFAVLASDNVAIQQVTVNDTRCDVTDANELEKTFLSGDVKKYHVSLPLVKGENVFTVTAVDTNGNKISQRIEVEGGNTTTPQDDNKLYDHRIAVVVGINNYSSFPSLEFARNDAQSIRDSLTKLGFDKIIEIYDRDATRERLLRVLKDELPGIMDENDSLMVYFAGHGATEDLAAGEQEGYIIPVDGEAKNFQGTAISMTSIRDMIPRYRAKHILLVFDSCYSGLGLKRSGGTKTGASDFIKMLSQKRSAQILTAGGKNETAGEEKGHGVFTNVLLQTLDGQEAYMLASDIGQIVRKKVSEKTNYQQTPLFGWLDGEGDFIFETQNK